MIVDGAVFVPQLVIDGVQVPAVNLAALLIGQEPVPAAGGPAPPSSGGNFEVPVGDIGDPFDLGDLLPPTDLVFTPPTFEDVFPDLPDDEPEVVITTPENPAGAVAASTNVNEAGLPARGSEPPGSNSAANSETSAGTIVITSGDAPFAVTVNGVAVTAVGQTIAGQFGTLTITSIAPTVIGYSYTLADNTTGNSTVDNFAVAVTDTDGDVANATLAVNIIDDVPTARNDTDTTESGASVATGNVVTGADTTSGAAGADTVGADNASVSGIVSGTGTGFTAVGAGGATIAGQFGSLTINADGSYTYTKSPSAPGGATEVFTYRLTDGDGDNSTATLTINLPDATPVVGANATVLLDDDALANGNPGGTGDDADAANTTGTLSGSGGDGALTFAFQLTGAPAGFTYVSDGAGGVLVQQGGVTVLTVTLDSASGAYTVVQNAPIAHPAGSDENNQAFTLNYTATDLDGDSASGTLDIDVDDDTPIASATVLGGTVDEDGVPGGIAGGNGDVAGQATVASGSVAPLFSSGADTPLTFSLSAVTSGLPALTSNGVAVTYAVNGNTLTASAGGNTVFTFVLNADGSYTFTLVDQLDHAAGNDENDLTISLGSILVATDADGDSVTANAGGLVITVDDDTPTASATLLTGTVDEDGVPGGLAGGPGDVPGEATIASGSVATLFNSGADAPLTFSLLANTAGLPALTSNGVAVTYVVNGNTLTASAGGNTVFTFVLNANGSYTFTLVDQLDHALGPVEDNLSISLGSIISATDADGDSVTASANGLVITVNDDTPTASATVLGGTVDEDGVPGGLAGGTDDVAGEAIVASGNVATLFNSGADQPLSFSLSADTSGLPALTSAGVAITYAVVGNTLTASAGQSTVFTFVLNADGSYTFTLVDQLDHEPGGNENDLLIALGAVVQATDADGDTVTANAGGLVITVDDDTPTATATVIGGTVDEDGVPGGLAGGTDDVAGENLIVPGSVATLFNSGADAPLSFSLSADTSGLPALTSAGVAVTYAVVGDTLTASAGGNTVFTFVLNADGSFTFTLVDQLDHAPGNDENNLTIALGAVVQATDADGDTVTANANGLVITVDDDTPVAVDDDNSIPTGSLGPATGNVLADDSAGADAPGTVTAVVSVNEPGNPDTDAGANFEIAGEFGVLTLNTDGSYSYARDPGTPGGVDDVFTYTLTDADGDSTTATLTISLDDARPVVGPNALVQVDDDAVVGANGNPGGVDDDPDAVNTTGTLSGSGGDPALTWRSRRPGRRPASPTRPRAATS